MASKKRTYQMEKLARIYDAEILPLWSQRFGQLILRKLSIPEKSQVLDAACATGYPSVEILRRMGRDCRLIAIDGSSLLLDHARKKIKELGAEGVFFRTDSIEPRLSFADDVYDYVICNLGLAECADRPRAVAEFARVAKPQGQVMCTLPIHGTFAEFYDIFREVLTKHDRHDTLDRLTQHLETTYPTIQQCEDWMTDAGLVDVSVESAEWQLLFRSSREFFFAPVIEFGPLSVWKRLAGVGQEMQDVFWYIKEAIDAYFEGRAFEVTVKAACLFGTKPAASEAQTGQVLLIDDLEEITQNLPVVDLDDDEVALADDDDEEEMAETIDAHPAVTLASGSSVDIDMDEVSQVAEQAEPESKTQVEQASRSDLDDVEIQAFKEGAERPDHLDSPAEDPPETSEDSNEDS